jgi:ABC-2 type transport system permease protein
VSTVALQAAQRRATLALAGREVRRVLSLWTQTILPPVLTAVLFLAVLGGALGDRIRVVEGVAYLDFILPGLLVMTVASQTFANNSTSLFQAKSEGYIDDVLTSPLRPWQLALAYLAGGLVRGFASALAVALLALPFVGDLERPAVAVAALLLTGLVFAALGVITGVWAETFDQHSFVAGIVITRSPSSAASSTPRGRSGSRGKRSRASIRSTTWSMPRGRARRASTSRRSGSRSQ